MKRNGVALGGSLGEERCWRVWDVGVESGEDRRRWRGGWRRRREGFLWDEVRGGVGWRLREGWVGEGIREGGGSWGGRGRGSRVLCRGCWL